LSAFCKERGLPPSLQHQKWKMSFIRTPTGTPNKRSWCHVEDIAPISKITKKNCSDSMDVDDTSIDQVHSAMNAIVQVPEVPSRDPNLLYSNKSCAIAEGNGDIGKCWLMDLFVALSADGGFMMRIFLDNWLYQKMPGTHKSSRLA
jgi:hypothetical protein